MAREYLLSFLDGTSTEGVFETNERAAPWQNAIVCNYLEAIQSYTPECDEIYNQWHYIAHRAYAERAIAETTGASGTGRGGRHAKALGRLC